MTKTVQQGDILKVQRIKYPVLVVSKDFFNLAGEVIGCPIFPDGTPTALHIFVSANSMEGYVHCEKLTLLDLHVRDIAIIDHIHMNDVINITDAVQSIFDYI